MSSERVRMAKRIAAGQEKIGGTGICSIPGCRRPTMLASGKGLAPFHCGVHKHRKARHGSHWHTTYSASELRPYVVCAAAYIKQHIGDPAVGYAVMAMNRLLAFSGRSVAADEVRFMSPKRKARVAFARLQDAGIGERRLLAIYLGVAALIEDDWESDRTDDFRVVQAAKAVHRLASGTHKKWEIPLASGRLVVMRKDVFPRAAGAVLRHIGTGLEEATGTLRTEAVVAIIAARVFHVLMEAYPALLK